MTKTTRAALLALPVAAVAVPVGGAYATDGKDRDPAGTKAVRESRHEIAQWLRYEGKDKKAAEDMVAELKAQYEAPSKAVLEEIRVEVGVREPTDAEIAAAIDYIVHETIKDERRKLVRGRAAAGSGAHGAGLLELLGMPAADAACPATTDPGYKQVRIGIGGGRYDGHSFNGGSELYDVRATEDTRSCEKTYEPHFRDEDRPHPVLDAVCDRAREVMHGRVHDVESFTIRNNSQIKFDNTWSPTHGYDYPEYWVRGFHGTAAKAYVPGQTVHVSSTWNRMMDTPDTNRSLAKSRVP